MREIVISVLRGVLPAIISTCCFIGLDFFSGLLKAFKTGTFRSGAMREGLFHKAALLTVMFLGVLVDCCQSFVDIGIAIPVTGIICGYIVLMEVGSTVENVSAVNSDIVPVKVLRLFGLDGNKEE